MSKLVFESFAALRMSGTTSGHRGGPGVGIAIAGIALSFIIMLISISVVTGFKRQITDRIIGFNADLNIYALSTTGPNPPESTGGIRLSPGLKSIIEKSTGSSAPELVFDQPAILKTDENFSGLVLRAMADGEGVRFIESALTEGTMPADTALNTVTISCSTARALKLHIGDKVFCHIINGNRIRSRALKVCGIYDTHFAEFDRKVAIVPLAMLQQLNNVGEDIGTAIAVYNIGLERLDDAYTNLSADLYDMTQQESAQVIYQVDDVRHTGALYFSWLSLLDTNVVVILILMAVVASFTLISALFIIILRNVRAIGLFKAMGASNSQIRRLFILIAQKVVLYGLLIGNAVGLTIIMLQRTTHFIPLDAESYYLDFVPMELDWPVILILNIATIIISVGVLILPSHIIARVTPASALSYE